MLDEAAVVDEREECVARREVVVLSVALGGAWGAGCVWVGLAGVGTEVSREEDGQILGC